MVAMGIDSMALVVALTEAGLKWTDPKFIKLRDLIVQKEQLWLTYVDQRNRYFASNNKAGPEVSRSQNEYAMYEPTTELSSLARLVQAKEKEIDDYIMKITMRKEKM
jgi:hypothetical protein